MQFFITKNIYHTHDTAGLPSIKPSINFKPQQTYGVPAQQYGPPSAPPSHHSFPSFPKPIHGAGCDGWKPIPGPSIGTQQAFAHSNTASIQTSLPENSYLPPVSNNIPLADTSSYLQVQPLPTNLQLPIAEPLNFNHHADLGANLASGLGLTTINVVKSEGIEVHLFISFFISNRKCQLFDSVQLIYTMLISKYFIDIICSFKAIR